MFCSNFSFTIFSLMFFSLFSKVFADILEIYELPKIYNEIPKYCQKPVLTIIIYQTNSMSQRHQALELYMPLLTLLKMCPRILRTLLALNFKKILGKTFVLKLVSKESFVLSLFCTINLAHVLEINIFGIDYSNLRHLKKSLIVLQVRTFKNYNKCTPAFKDY